jgi:hypothetical protein
LIQDGQSTQAEIVSLQGNVKALQNAPLIGILGPDARQQIADIIMASKNASKKVRETRVLEGLRFDMVNERFNEVVAAHEKTLRWVFDSHGSRINDTHKRSAKKAFISWLRHGNGIFHISGKPGSGKSTLMKYVCCNEATKTHLKEWAGANKSLAIGKFFFWRPGTTLQKSIRGLIRSLLFSVLSDCPDLIPLACPKQWDAASTHTSIISDADSEIRAAFNELIGQDAVYAHHKFAFFIDGLDEFDGNHGDLIRQLKNWTLLRPDDVKLCVSSREEIIFQESFSDYPSFRLHEITREDILGLVQESLASYQLYPQIWEGETTGDRDSFEEGIVDKSDGVFLWVSLIFKVIEDGLFSGDQLPQLREKIDSLPTELEDLFWHLFNSIHKSDRKEAYLMLKVALQASLRWPLLRYCFIEDYLKDPEFAYGHIQPLTSTLLIHGLQRAKRKVYGKCRGLLEIHTAPYDSNLFDYNAVDWSYSSHSSNEQDSDRDGCDGRDSDGGDWGGYDSATFAAQREWLTSFESCVKFTHRSIIEFLKGDKVRAAFEAVLGEFDLTDVLCQTFLAHTKVMRMPNLYYGRPIIARDSPPAVRSYIETNLSPSLEFDLCTIFAEFVSFRDGHDPLRLCGFLDNLLESVPSVKGSIVIGGSITFYSGSMERGREIFTSHTPVRIVVLAALYGIYEYVLRDVPGTRSIISKNFWPQHLTPLTARTAASFDYKTALGLMRIFELLEISPDLPAGPANIPPWHNAILEVLINGQFNYLHWALPFFVTCLLRGGDPRFYLRVELSAPGEKYAPVSLFCGEKRRPRRISGKRTYQPCILLTRPLKRFLLQHGREISLRCLFGIWFPRHAKIFQEMIDWIEERGPELSAEQMQELHDTFELATRPLRLADPQQIDLNIHRVEPVIMNISFGQ